MEPQAHDNCIAVASGKGGVLKTTLACHLAALAAQAGQRVLLVDLDPQGNAMFDLGYDSDGGRNLADALGGSARLQPLPAVRDRLDVIAGGAKLDPVGACVSWNSPESWRRLARILAPLAAGYDLIVLDSPTREPWLRHQILTAARQLVVPTGIDQASRTGLPDIARTVDVVREHTNPYLDVLAVVIGPLPVTSTATIANARRLVGELIGDDDLVAETTVRCAPAVAQHCRERGLLSHEYASVPGAPAAARHVAGDWRALIGELLGRHRELLFQEMPHVGG